MTQTHEEKLAERQRLASAAVAAVPRLDGVDWLDPVALGDALLDLDEETRVSLHPHAYVLIYRAADAARDRPAHSALSWQSTAAMLLGTWPAARFAPTADPPPVSLGHRACLESFHRLYLARPPQVQRAIRRNYWEQPFDNRPVLWVVWHDLVQRGLMEVPTQPMYLRGAMLTLAAFVPWQESGHPTSEERYAGMREWLRMDPSMAAVIRRAYAARAVADADAGFYSRLVAALFEVGAITMDEVVAVETDGVARAERSGRAAMHRRVLNSLVPHATQFASVSAQLLRIVESEREQDRAWALKTLEALASSGHDVSLEPSVGGLRDAVGVGSVATVTSALALCEASGRRDLTRLLAAAALANPKVGQQRVAWKALRKVSEPGEEVLDLAEYAVDALHPSVRPEVVTWLAANGRGVKPDGASDADLEPGAAAVADGSEFNAESTWQRRDDALSPARVEDLEELHELFMRNLDQPLDLDRFLDAITRNSRADTAAQRERILARVVKQDEYKIASSTTGWIDYDGEWPSYYAWFASTLPYTRPFGGIYAHGESGMPAPLYFTDWDPNPWDTTGQKDTHAEPAQFGPMLLRRARLWEAVVASHAGTTRLLATPQWRDGTISAAEFAARLPHAFDPALCYDSIQAILRLEPTCDDDEVVDAVRACDHPAAVAALALWGRAPMAMVESWILPTVEHRLATLPPAVVEHRERFAYDRYRATGTELAPALLWTFTEPKPPLLLDPLGCVLALGIHREPYEPRHPIQTYNTLFASIDAPSPVAAFLTSPWNTDHIAAVMSSDVLRYRLSATGMGAEERAILHLLEARPAIGEGWCSLLAVGLVSASAGLRILVVDAIGAGLPNGAPQRVGDYMGRIVAAWGSGLARAGAALVSASGISFAAAVAADDIFRAALPHLPPKHRQLGDALESFEVVRESAGSRAFGPELKNAVEGMQTGSARAAAAAGRLLEVSP